MVVKRAERQAIAAGRLIALVFLVLLLIAGGTVWLVFSNASAARNDLLQAYEQLVTTQQLRSALQNAETGQRGFLLSRNPQYLEPYKQAITQIEPILDIYARGIPQQQSEQISSAGRLRRLIDAKLAEIAETIQDTQEGRYPEALHQVQSNTGEVLMDEIRTILDQSDQANRQIISERGGSFEQAAAVRLLGTLFVVCLLLAVLVGAGVLLRHAFRLLRDAEIRADAAAEQLRVSLDSLSQGISVFSADHTLIAWNECFVELFSIPQSLLQAGTPYSAFVRHDWTDEEGDFLETPEQVAAVPPESTGRLKPVVYERTRKDGRTFELRRTPLSIGGFVITYTDISARVTTEKQLRQSQRLDAVGQLTGGIAHDFNNLLTIIVGNLDLARTRSNDPAISRNLELAVGAAERGAKLTSQLLAFARRQSLEPEPINVNRLLTDLAEFFQRSLGEHIEVEVITAPGAWTVLADQSQLENALFNLALNARDAMPDGGKLTIEAANAVLDDVYAKAHSEVQSGSYVMLAVTDRGTGMPADVIARAFDPFFTTKPQGKGSGLGLSQVFGFVKQSGGHINVYSEIGHGTTVKLYLPKTTRTPRQTTLAPDDLKGGQETILIVEDNDDVRRTALSMLRDMGYRCIEAADGKQALEALRSSETTIHALFTDIMLPGGMLGRELAERARALMPRIRVLYTSGYTQNVIMQRSGTNEEVVFLNKPFKKSELGRKLRQILDQPAAEEMSAAAAVAEPDTDMHPRSVLVVEDELMVLWLTLDLIRELGHTPIPAKTANEALAILDANRSPIDVLMTDLGLPDMRGDVLVLQARSRQPDLPVLVASGYGDNRPESLNGISRLAFLSKPYEAASLRDALAAVGIECKNLA